MCEWAEGKLNKLHVQMGHADATLIHRMLSLSKSEVDIARIKAAIQKCGRSRDDAIPQAPRLNRYQSVAPGEEIFMDIYYLLSEEKEDARNHPSIICVCAFHVL